MVFQTERLQGVYEASASQSTELDANELDALLAQFAKDAEHQRDTEEVISGSANGIFLGAAAAGAFWLMSGSSLLAVLASSLPTWARFDPIFIVSNHSSREEDDVSVSDLIQQNAK